MNLFFVILCIFPEKRVLFLETTQKYAFKKLLLVHWCDWGASSRLPP